MSFLTPLYILGALAIAAPILFHLIRRRPQGEVSFSSLMFLTPTPPRLTRRSRLDNWLLLLLRAAALGLLALAFARPFLREVARLDAAEASMRRVAILVDTSASMRRGNLWEQARTQAERAIAECRPGDELAVFAFDRTTRPLLSFAESSALDAARRQAVARARLAGLAPTWAATELGQALVDAVAAVEDVADSSEEAGRMPRRVILVSDLQRGGKIEALGGLEWPPEVELELRTVTDDRPNAGLHRLADASSGEAEADAALRVRVTNAPDANGELFALRWADAAGAAAGPPLDVYVPPGESRVVRVPAPPPLPAGSTPARALLLEGDAHDFDNTIHLADDRPDDRIVVFVGDDEADDPDGLLYYLERAFLDAPGPTVQLRRAARDEVLALDADRAVPLVVLAGEPSPENLRALDRYARAGGTLLVVLTGPEHAGALESLLGLAPWGVAEAEVPRDAMLGRIDFGHPLFAPFAGAQFNDFTKIRFWKYRRLDAAALADARVVARFENGDPALVERKLDRGRLFVLTSGWQPADSQLARSSKFLPLMAGLLDDPATAAFDATALRVGDPIPLPEAPPDARLVFRKPDGSTVEVAPGTSSFEGVDQPGVYTIEHPDGPRTYAANLDPAESDTAPLPVETLEQLGCRLVGAAAGAARADDAAQRRQMRNAELEGRQKLWRWLILGAIGVLIVETWLAGRHARAGAPLGEVASA